MFDRTVFFRQIARPGRKRSFRSGLVASRKATPFGGGQERNAICEANCESESMQTARPGRSAKHFDQGKVELLKIGIGEWILIADVKSKALRQKFNKIQKT